jgi:hypothetical protein
MTIPRYLEDLCESLGIPSHTEYKKQFTHNWK